MRYRIKYSVFTSQHAIAEGNVGETGKTLLLPMNKCLSWSNAWVWSSYLVRECLRLNMSRTGSMRASFAKHLGLFVLITRLDKFPLVGGHFSYPHFASQVM